MKILISHQKGGVGKSTLAVALANLFVSNDMTCAIVDMDHQGTIVKFKGLYNNLGIEVYSNISPTEINQLKENIVIIDTPPYLFDSINEMMNMANLILVPSKPNLADITAVESTINIIKANNVLDKAIVVFNQVEHKRGKDIKNKEAYDEVVALGMNIVSLDNSLDLTVQLERILEGQFEVQAKEQVANMFDEVYTFLNKN